MMRNALLLGLALAMFGCAESPTSSRMDGLDVPAPPGAFGPAAPVAPVPTQPAPVAVPAAPAAPAAPPTAPATPVAGVMGTAGMGGAVPPVTDPGDTGTVDPGAPLMSSTEPMVPAVTGDCPTFVSSSISFGGLGGITLQAGPKAAGATAPMVFYWHGTGSTAGEYAGMAGAVHAGVMAEGGVLISFQGTTGGDLLSGTNIFGKGDLDLADQLAACAVRDHNVDPHRIFATGCSAGGLFSTAQAALRSSYIAAAAPNSGGFTFPQMFQTAYTPALMTIHGAPGRDVVIIDFSDSSATADMAFKGRDGFVINCNHGGGHCGGGGLAPSIWEFFKAHPYGVDPEPWAGGLPAGFHSSCEIY